MHVIAAQDLVPSYQIDVTKPAGSRIANLSYQGRTPAQQRAPVLTLNPPHIELASLTSILPCDRRPPINGKLRRSSYMEALHALGKLEYSLGLWQGRAHSHPRNH
jgi:hypothetical protein